MRETSKISELYELNGKTALITGATGKLTRSIVSDLAKQGVKLALQYYRNANCAEALSSQLSEMPSEYNFYQCNLLEPESPENLAQQVISDFGKIDILINAASKFHFATLEQTNDSLLDEMISLNITAPFKLARSLSDNFKSISGSVINIVDIWALNPQENFIAYSIAKAGLTAFTKALAKTFAPNTTVNAIAPGIIDFPENIKEDKRKEIIKKIPLLRCGTYSEISQTVIYILKNRYLTGQIITVDGGRLL